jgi:hypothetical protein
LLALSVAHLLAASVPQWVSKLHRHIEGNRIVAYQEAPEKVVHFPTRIPPARNVRPIEEGQFKYSPVPDPIRQSEFSGIGRVSAWVRRPMAIFQNIADILAVDNPDFSFAPQDHLLDNTPTVPYGLQNPLHERVNVSTPNSVKYGSLLVMNMPPYYGFVPHG